MQDGSITAKTGRHHGYICASAAKVSIQAVATQLFQSVLCLMLAAFGNSVAAQSLTPNSISDQAPKVQTTLVIFTERKAHKMTDQQWRALVAALRDELASNSPEIRLLTEKTVGASSQTSGANDANAKIEILRGDQIVPGQTIENPITAYLLGDCNVHPHPPRILFDDIPTSGALGWVRSNHGHIEPFVHVECDRLAQMLATKAYGHDRIYWDQLLATAIARVILHEWIHIVTQSARHAGHGVAKAQFGPADLFPSTVPSAVHGKGE